MTSSPVSERSTRLLRNDHVPRHSSPMKNQFTAYEQREGEWFIATSPEVPEANGQGYSKEECLHSLAAALELVFEERRASARNELKWDAEEALVAVG